MIKNIRKYSIRRTCHSKTGAFTLIEVLVAMVLLSTVIISIITGFQSAITALGEARDCIWANRIIGEKMDEMRISAMTGKMPDYGIRTGKYPAYYGDFRWETRMDNSVPGLRSSPMFSFCSVTITAWRENSSRKYSITTYISALFAGNTKRR